MNCIYCGHEIGVNVKVCPSCGKSDKINRELINKAIDGSQDAITELYNITYNKIYHTVKAMIRDEDSVLDIVQDSYIKGFKSLKQLESPESFQPWMRRIAINKTKDFLKRNKPILFADLSYDDEDIDFEDERTEHLPEKVIEQKETTRLINEILDSLSEEQRVVIGMFYYEQMSVKEIAEELECAENTVKSRLNYGRKKIEAQVRELEKKGTKLYSLAPLPFLLWLFKCADVQAAETPSTIILEALKMKIASGSATAVAESAATEVITKSVFSGGLKTVAGAVSKTIAGKIIAGILAVSVVIGGTAAVSSLINSGKDAEEETKITEGVIDTTELIEVTELPDSTVIPTVTPTSTGTPLPTATPTGEVVELSIGDYIMVSYLGYSGNGEVKIDFNDEAFFEYARTLWTDEELDEKMTDLEELVSSFSFVSDKSTELSNGDSYTVNIIYNETLAKELRVSFTNVSRTFFVEGVAEKTLIDPFSSDIFEYCYHNSYQMPYEEPYPINEVHITYNGISPDISMSVRNCYYDKTNPLSMIEYTLDKSENLKNGDSVIMTASFKDDVDASAYELKSTSMKINIEGHLSYVDSMSQLNSESISYIQNEIIDYFVFDVLSEYPILKFYDGSHYETNEIIPAVSGVDPYGAISFLDSEFKILSEGRCIYPFIIEVNDVVLNPVVDYDLNYNLDSAPVEDFPALYGYFILNDLIVAADGVICYKDYLQFELGNMYEDKQYMNQAISGIN